MSKHLSLALIVMLLGTPRISRAQDLEGITTETSTTNQVEDIIEKEEAKTVKRPDAPAPKRGEKTQQVQSLSDLANLAPFSDIAVIQRRFLPKTGRFELTGALFTNLNNPFFNSIGGDVRASYYLREQWALEGIAAFASTSKRQVTEDLEKKRGITTDTVVSSKGFYLLAVKWNPIYGKITWLNKSIVPFDLNFNLGFGTTTTTDNQNAPTLHLGTSQVFALSKSMAFRWDLIWNTYQATGTDAVGTKSTLTQNDLFLGLGMSFYFPEATYR